MKALLIRTQSPLHLGVGQSPSALDLPIARDHVTGAPHLPGSSLKGSFRSMYARKAREDETPETELFGPIVRGKENASEYSGALMFHDARLVLFPVASPLSGWAWVTSPALLAQLRPLMSAEERAEMTLPEPDMNEAYGPKELVTSSDHRGEFWVRDLNFTFKPTHDLNRWADWLTKAFALDPSGSKFIHRRLVCLHDDIMAFIYRQMSMVVTRNRVDPYTGGVADRALWNEELLPPETFFLSGVSAIPARCEALQKSPEELIGQLITRCPSITIGGKVSVGRGLCSVLPMREGGSQHNETGA